MVLGLVDITKNVIQYQLNELIGILITSSTNGVMFIITKCGEKPSGIVIAGTKHIMLGRGITVDINGYLTLVLVIIGIINGETINVTFFIVTDKNATAIKLNDLRVIFFWFIFGY